MIPLLFFSMAKTKMPAYILFTAPVLFMITGEFWESSKNVKLPRKKNQTAYGN